MGGLPAATFPMQIRRSSYRTAIRNRAKGSAGRRAQGCWGFPGSDRWCKKSQPYIGQVKKTTSITGIPAPCSFPPPLLRPTASVLPSSLPVPTLGTIYMAPGRRRRRRRRRRRLTLSWLPCNRLPSPPSPAFTIPPPNPFFFFPVLFLRIERGRWALRRRTRRPVLPTPFPPLSRSFPPRLAEILASIPAKGVEDRGGEGPGGKT